MVLGGRKVPARRPRPRTANGKEELKLRTFSHFASEDLLQEQTVERVLAGLSTRRYRCLEPTATADRSVSRSAVSRRFVKHTGPALYSLRVGLGGERRRHRRHVLGWTVGGTNG